MNYKALALGAAIGFLFAVAPSCGGQKCSTANCASGCCDANDKCVTAPNNAANATCGTSGNKCVDCTKANQLCTNFVCTGGTGGGSGGGTGGGSGGGTGGGSGGGSGGGTGGGSAACGRDSQGNDIPCPSGCCTAAYPNGVCLSGTSAGNCGSGGALCQNCSTTGGVCQNQTCVSSGQDAGTDAGAGTGVVGKACGAPADCSGLDGGSCRQTTNTGAGTYAGGYCTRGCGAAGDCPSDSLCISFAASYDEPNRLCLKKCSPPNSLNSPDCRTPGYACYGLSGGGTTGICWIYPPPAVDAGPPADRIGVACGPGSVIADGGEENCKGPPDNGKCLLDAGHQGGYCTAECDDNDHCSVDGGAICIDFGNESICQRICNQPAQGQGDCRQDYVCQGYLVRQADGGVGPSTNGFCRPNCNNAYADCGAGFACGDAGYCAMQVAENVGTTCTTDVNCHPPTDGFCFPESADAGFMGGYCSVECNSNAKCSPDGGAVCINFGQTLSACMASCAGPGGGQSTCRTGYVCMGVQGLTGGICYPNCNNPGAGCPAPRVCQASGYCQ